MNQKANMKNTNINKILSLKENMRKTNITKILNQKKKK